AREAPLSGHLVPGQMAPAGELAYLAHVALEVGGQLLHVHHVVAHGRVLLRWAATRDLGLSLANSGDLRPPLASCYVPRSPKRPGSSKPLPPLSSCSWACVCWLRPCRR